MGSSASGNASFTIKSGISWQKRIANFLYKAFSKRSKRPSGAIDLGPSHGANAGSGSHLKLHTVDFEAEAKILVALLKANPLVAHVSVVYWSDVSTMCRDASEVVQ